MISQVVSAVTETNYSPDDVVALQRHPAFTAEKLERARHFGSQLRAFATSQVCTELRERMKQESVPFLPVSFTVRAPAHCRGTVSYCDLQLILNPGRFKVSASDTLGSQTQMLWRDLLATLLEGGLTFESVISQVLRYSEMKALPGAVNERDSSGLKEALFPRVAGLVKEFIARD